MLSYALKGFDGIRYFGNTIPISIYISLENPDISVPHTCCEEEKKEKGEKQRIYLIECVKRKKAIKQKKLTIVPVQKGSNSLRP